MKRIWFIVNPVSGTKERKVWVDKAVKELDGRFEVTVRKTEYAGHGHIIALEAVEAGVDTVVAVGGDGTVNEIGSAVVGSKTNLAIFPMGSGNGLARELGMSTKRASKAIDSIVKDMPEAVDYGMAGERPFFCTCGTGFDAEVARLFVGNTTRGFWQYFILCVKTYFKFKPVELEFNLNGVTNRRSAFLFNAANIKQYGFGAQIAPKASVTDGLLDVTIVPKINIFRALLFSSGMFTHRVNKFSFVESFTCQELKLTIADNAPFHIDGDYVEPENRTMTIKVVEGGINILC